MDVVVRLQPEAKIVEWEYGRELALNWVERAEVWRAQRVSAGAKRTGDLEGL